MHLLLVADVGAVGSGVAPRINDVPDGPLRRLIREIQNADCGS
jgi:hypothetical protein